MGFGMSAPSFIQPSVIQNAVNGVFPANQPRSQSVEDQAEDARRANEEEVKQQREALQKRTKEFRANLPQFKEQQANMAEDNEKRNLQGNVSNVIRGSNRRGLLYSGVNQGAQAAAGSGYATAVSQRRANINQQADEIANQMDQGTIDVGLADQRMKSLASNAAYQQQLQAQQSEQKAQGGLLGGVGSLIGTIFGGKR